MWFIQDPCGVFACLFTYGAMVAVSTICTLVSTWQISPSPFATSLGISVYILLLGLATVSHLKCVFTDPGALPKNTAPPPITDHISPRKPDPSYCRKCKCKKPLKTHHCGVCKRCIERMDHHCPWVNNCVGKNNQKFFILFLFYIGLACLYSFFLLMLRATYCMGGSESPLCQRTQKEVMGDVVLGLIGGLLSAFFCLFACVMLLDQLSYILNNTSTIDSLKNVKYEKRPARKSFEEAFHSPLSINWFLPVQGNLQEIPAVKYAV